MQNDVTVPKQFFKGWAIPGPDVPRTDVPEIDAGESLDAISGQFKLFQLAKGHRFSTDDVLTAWYGTSWCSTAHRVLDLGSGIGSVGMIAAWRLPGAKFVTIEAQEESVRLARKSARYNGLAERYEIRQGDFRDPGVLGEGELFDLVLGSPPYFPLEAGVLGDHPQKIACRFETRGDILNYCQAAAPHLAMGGVFACVFPVKPEAQKQRVFEAAKETGLCVVRWRPIVLREGEVPLLGVFILMRAEHLPEEMRGQTWEEPALTIRKTDGSVHPEYRAVKMAFGFPP